MKRILILLFFCLCNVVVLAQEQGEISTSLVTDRPGQSASSFTVGTGVWQFETGFSYQKFEGTLISNDPLNPGIIPADFQSFTYNSTLVRYGISDKIELRFTQELRGSRALVDGTVLASSGAELIPTYIGAKVALVEGDGVRPAIAVLANLGGTPFSDIDGTTTFDFRFNFYHQLSDKVSLAYNLGGVISSEFTGLYTLIGGYSLSPKLSAFVELYGFLNEGFTNDHQIDFGFSYLISNDLQLDMFGGAGFSDISPDSLFGFGFSARIPRR